MEKWILQSLFESWKVPLPNKKWTPCPNTDDFGQEIKTLLLSPETKNKILSSTKSAAVAKLIWEGISFVHTPQNLKFLGDKLGISIKEASRFYYVRDTFIRLHDGSIGSSQHTDLTERAVECVHSSNLYLDKTATTRTRNQLFNHWSGFGSRYFSDSQQDRELYFSESHKTFEYAYVEGGNVFTLSDKQGKIHVFVGEDHRLQTLIRLELEGGDWSQLAQEAGFPSFASVVSNIESLSTDEQVFSICEEMYSLGLLRCQGQTGLIDQKSQLNILLSKFFMARTTGKIISRDERGWYRALAARGGLIKPFQIGEDKKAIAKAAAAEYQAKLTVVHALIAKDFQIPNTHLHFIAQANYHLDAFMMPGPQGSIFLLNYRFCAELIQELLNQKEALKLSEGDLFYLSNYFDAAQKFDLEFGDLLATVEAQLRGAGFTVIPFPGHFIYEPLEMYEEFPMPSEGLCINFVNSITGWSSKIQAFYSISHGLHVGEQVGKLFMDAFTAFLQSYIPSLQVYFVGYDPENPDDFSEALDFWNRLETQSGVHCVTFPL